VVSHRQELGHGAVQVLEIVHRLVSHKGMGHNVVQVLEIVHRLVTHVESITEIPRVDVMGVAGIIGHKGHNLVMMSHRWS
jgi:hypothetical protein